MQARYIANLSQQQTVIVTQLVEDYIKLDLIHSITQGRFADRKKTAMVAVIKKLVRAADVKLLYECSYVVMQLMNASVRRCNFNYLYSPDER